RDRPGWCSATSASSPRAGSLPFSRTELLRPAARRTPPAPRCDAPRLIQRSPENMNKPAFLPEPVADPAALGFSAARLGRIRERLAADVDAGGLPGAVWL